MTEEDKGAALFCLIICVTVIIAIMLWCGVRVYQAHTVGDVEYVCTRKWSTEAVLNCTRTS